MSDKYDFTAFRQTVIDSIGPYASPRIKHVIPLLVTKLHEFCIEADVTVDEWLFTCNMLVQAGQMSSAARNEVILMSDVLGIESLVDTLAHVRTSKEASISTHSAILGPFYRDGLRTQAHDTTIVRQPDDPEAYTYLHGQVFGSDGKPLEGATIDIWHDASDGLYDSQSPDKPEFNCRGRFLSDSDGRYSLVCLKPTPYPIPNDGPTGDMLTAMDRHPFRPAHIHYMVQAPKHRVLVTQVFDKESKYLEDDSVFAVKDSLVVDFLPLGNMELPKNLEDRDKVKFQLKYDIHLGAGDDTEVDVAVPIGAEPTQ